MYFEFLRSARHGAWSFMCIISFIHPNCTLRLVSSSPISIKETQGVGRISKLPLDINSASTEEVQPRGLSVGKHMFFPLQIIISCKARRCWLLFKLQKESLEELDLVQRSQIFD